MAHRKKPKAIMNKAETKSPAEVPTRPRVSKNVAFHSSSRGTGWFDGLWSYWWRRNADEHRSLAASAAQRHLPVAPYRTRRKSRRPGRGLRREIRTEPHTSSDRRGAYLRPNGGIVQVGIHGFLSSYSIATSMHSSSG